MKLHRLKLANYRGIEALEVRFEATGVTVVEGPNEVGKSSLAEAIQILLDEKDRTARREVKALKPVDRDLGSEIEADIETGPYRFTYSKRYHRKPETRLVVTHPRPESHTGDEAHERVAAILQETVDLALWKALRLVQGDRLELPQLGGGRALGMALERAAGVVAGGGAGTREEGLFDTIHYEFLRYWTENGKEKKEVTDARAEVARLGSEVAALEAEQRTLQGDLDRAAEIAQRLDQLRRAEPELERASAERELALQALGQQETTVAATAAEASAARALRDEAARKAGERVAGVRQLEQAQVALAEAESRYNALAPARAAAEVEADAARAFIVRAEADLREIEHNANRLAAEATYHDDRNWLRQFGTRRERHLAAIAARNDALAVLDQAAVSDELLARLRDADREIERARARLEASSPSVRIEAGAGLEMWIGTEHVRLEPGQTRDATIAGELRLEFPGLATVTVTGRAGTAGLEAALAGAERGFAELGSDAGVSSVAAAAAANERWREANQALLRYQESCERDLIDLTLADIESRMERSRRRIDEYLATLPAGTVVDSDALAAHERAQTAFGATQAARAALEAGRSRLDRAREQTETMRVEADVEARLLEGERIRVAQAQQELQAARASVSDEELAARAREATALAANAETVAREAAAVLAQHGPESIRERVEIARGALEQARSRRRELEDEGLRTAERLAVHGERGIDEDLGRRRARLTAARDREQDLCARATAAKLLYQTFEQERSAAHSRYVAPLRERIESLGRNVYGDTLNIELAEDLSITSRTLHGCTVPFESLSGGTREQLSILLRLAAAMIVAPDGGVPLILDDALGYSDSTRLANMGAVLALAGRHCQVIVLTCFPERYRAVGGAKVVELGRRAGDRRG